MGSTVKLSIAIRRIRLIVDFMILYATHNSRLVTQILEVVAFGFFILICKSTIAAIPTLLLRPDSSSAILCADVCEPLGKSAILLIGS